MSFYIIYMFAISAILQQVAAGLVNDEEIINRCLKRLTNAEVSETRALQLEQLNNFTDWEQEKIPCFTRCISTAKGWFDIETHGWKKERIAQELGANVFNYCRYELDRPFDNACDFAHRGFRCLKQAEKYIPLTHASILGCASELNITLDQLRQYIPLQLNERIPCFFSCFARKMNLYSPSYEWNVLEWEQAFGPPGSSIVNHRSICKAQHAQEQHKCAWMYEEYICLERHSYQQATSAKRNNLICQHNH